MKFNDLITFLASIDLGTIVQLLIALVGSGGFVGGLYMLLKLRPEAGQITVTAAQGALIVQSGVIENLQEELSRVRADNKTLRKKVDELEEKYNKLRERTAQIEQHSQEDR